MQKTSVKMYNEIENTQVHFLENFEDHLNG